MTIKELKHFMDEDDSIFIIDIREPYECEDGSICDLNIPLGQILNRIDEIPKDKNVVFYCNSGKRSKSLKYMLEKIHAFNNLSHLEGGYKGWVEQQTINLK